MFFTHSVMQEINFRIILLLSYFISIPIIGYTRALVAKKMGDDTGEQLGYLTVDPFVHTSMFWLVLMQFFRIGFGQYIPINPINIHGPRRGLKLLAAYLSDAAASFMLVFGAILLIPCALWLKSIIGFNEVAIRLLVGSVRVFALFNAALATFNVIVNIFYFCVFYFFEDFARDYEYVELIMLIGPILFLINFYDPIYRFFESWIAMIGIV